MKHLLLAALAAISLLSCKEQNTTAVDTSTDQVIVKDIQARLQPISSDSISVRALDYKNGNYWFAGSKGTYGSINKDHEMTKGLIKLNDEQDIEFRAIAATDQYTYILTAGNPALGYKIKHKDNSVEHVYTEVEERVFYDSMRFWDDQEGIAMGDPMGACFSIIKTYDGGATWGKLRCEELPDFVPGEAAFAASNSNIAIYNDHVWMATGGQMARVFHSPDRGSSWEIFNTPIIAGGEMTGIFAMDFYNSKIGVIIGGDWNKKQDNLYNKAITFNGGKSWKLLKNGPGYCSDIQFVPGTQGREIIAVGSSGVWWSGDQGQQWKQLHKEAFYTIKMINDTQGMLAGNAIMATINLERSLE